MAVIEQPDIIRQILEHLGRAIPSRAERALPTLARTRAVVEAPAWTDDPEAASSRSGIP